MEKIEQQQSSKTKFNDIFSSSSGDERSDKCKPVKSANKKRSSEQSSSSDDGEGGEGESDSESESEDVKLRQPIANKEELNRVKLSRFRIEK